MAELNIGPEENETPTPVLLYLLDAAVLLSETEAARALAQLLSPVHSMSTSWITCVCPARLLGAAAALLGKPEEARTYYQQALEVCAKVRFRPEIALTRLQLAELLLAESAKPSPFGRGQGEGNNPDALHKEASTTSTSPSASSAR